MAYKKIRGSVWARLNVNKYIVIMVGEMGNMLELGVQVAAEEIKSSRV